MMVVLIQQRTIGLILDIHLIHGLLGDQLVLSGEDIFINERLYKEKEHGLISLDDQVWIGLDTGK